MSKTLQTITPDHDEKDNYILKIVNTETSSEREYDRYYNKDDLDQAVQELKNDGSLSENEEIETKYVGHDVVIGNLWISKQEGTGDLIVTAEFQTFDSDGEVTSNQSSDEYIDLDSGQIDTYEHGLMRSETQWSYFDVNSVQEAINEVLQEYPIGDNILNEAIEQAEWRDEFEENQLRPGRENDYLAVNDADVFATDDGVYVSFKVITQSKQNGEDFPTYDKSYAHYGEFDIENNAIKLKAELEEQYSFNSEDIKTQLSNFLELTETQAAIEKATAEHIEKKHIQDIKSSIKNGETELVRVDFIENDHNLAATATFVSFVNDRIHELRWQNDINLETGLSADINSNDYNSLSADMVEVVATKLNNYLQANPISEDTLNRYRADADHQKILAAEFHGGQGDRSSNVAVSNLHIAINADKEVIANFDVIERKPINSDSQPYRYTEYVMMSEKVDLDSKSVVHKSQSSLDYGNYDHDEVRSAVSKKIQSDGLLSDRAVASIKNKIGAASEEKDKDEDRLRMVAR